MISKRFFTNYLLIFIFITKYCYSDLAPTIETLPLTADEMKTLTLVRDQSTNSGKINFDEFYKLLKEKNLELANKISSAREVWNNKFDNLQTDAKAWMEEVRQAKPTNGKTLTSDEMSKTMNKIRTSFNSLSEDAKKELEENFPAVVMQMGIENNNHINIVTKEPNEE
ncbi:Nematode fatty acid retinoid binding family and EF-hand domain pair-containing protein [Strongyloides ratti]|uniref:Nematode fatty acid retinoid binding family and EF-hand domain pair-containing protein n=1 Tax=Strongyloides ratti TaxID=34506 RepID=A0A090LHC2_STRRB|nr:Nematode fatty acid retinoid binding family and EF-hand domain pair-containing protein [Strongyloides ratti]CEF67533.1 Nematode fatty acid retinoid binding family and EF-hand domain pair-containing protein [Strongyloides ratti]